MLPQSLGMTARLGFKYRGGHRALAGWLLIQETSLPSIREGAGGATCTPAFFVATVAAFPLRVEN
jgi:hypothetical protein